MSEFLHDFVTSALNSSLAALVVPVTGALVGGVLGCSLPGSGCEGGMLYLVYPLLIIIGIVLVLTLILLAGFAHGLWERRESLRMMHRAYKGDLYPDIGEMWQDWKEFSGK